MVPVEKVLSENYHQLPDVEGLNPWGPPVGRPHVLGRLEALDLARGFAICLMILSHGIKGLMMFEQIPSWGLVPIHLVTKFSSSLFILVFGMALAVSVVPQIGTPSWPKRRKKLMLRGLVVFFWYKTLTILEMSHLFQREEILGALLYESFPVYVEVLGFYAIALLWIPWVLPMWKASPGWLRSLFPAIFFAGAALLSQHFDFFGNKIFQAFLVEHPDHYAWGQLSRAPLVFVGLLIGWMVQTAAATKSPRLLPFGVLTASALALFGVFLSELDGNFYENLVLIAKNVGKHPPEMQFMLFSMSGALLILAFSILGGKGLASLLSFVCTIGKNSLQAFVFHIVVLFVFYRFLFDYFHKVEYNFALFLALLLILLTYAWVKLTKWIKDNS